MSIAQLLAVVEVPHDDRVRCQAPDCNHPVFRRIHVVRENSAIHVYGSECFRKLFLGLPITSATPRYTTVEGKKLTDEERQLLIENTERIIQQFEAEEQAEAARKAIPVPNSPVVAAPHPPGPAPPPPKVISETPRRNAEYQAKQLLRSKYGVDPELPGWRGLVISE